MITILAPYFTPAVKAGGPIKSISGICQILAKNDLKYHVITRDRDIDGSLLENSQFDPKATYVQEPNSDLLKERFSATTVVWINSLYSIPFALKPLLTLRGTTNKTIIVSPRGQLLKGSLNTKKRLYLKAFKYLLRRSKNRILIHYTNEGEKEKSLNIFSAIDSVIFNNPISGIISEVKPQKEQNELTLGFFGRISPIKNVEFIVKLIPHLTSEIDFQIHGAIEDESYKEQLDAKIASANISNRISFHGNYNKDTFAERIKDVDLVVVPSFSENFCHVFFEAIEQGVLVMGSNGLPWKAINSLVSGTILPLEQDLWLKRINEVYKLNSSEYQLQHDKLIEFYKSIDQKVQQDVIRNFKTIENDYGVKG